MTPRDLNETAQTIENPPYDRQLEMDLLGAAMVTARHDPEPTVAKELLAVTKEEWFYFPEHRKIYRAIRECVANGVMPTSTGVMRQMIANGTYWKGGGSEGTPGAALLCTQCEDGPPDVTAVTWYSRNRLFPMYQRRAAQEMGVQLGHAANDNDPSEWLEWARRTSESLLTDAPLATDVKTAEIGIDGMIAEMSAGTAVRRLSSGLNRLDKAWKVRQSSLNVLAGSTGAGKTALALAYAYQTAKAGRPVLLVSCEMSERMVYARLAAARSGRGTDEIMHPQSPGQLDENREVLTQLKREVGENLIVLQNAGIDEAIATCELMKKAGKPVGLVVIDYLQILPAKERRGENRERQVSDLARRCLTEVAHPFEVPVLLLSQLNRNPQSEKNRAPQLHDLRESGAIEQHADTVMMLHHPKLERDQYDESVQVRAYLRKDRYGTQEATTLVLGAGGAFRDAGEVF